MNVRTQKAQRGFDRRFDPLRSGRLCVLLLAAGAASSVVPPAALAKEELPAAEHVSRANRALADGELETALEGYRQAEVLMPDAPELAYNQAVAYYRMRDFAKARELFSQTLTTRDLELETKAKFNLGNCQYSEALEKMSNLQEAIDQLRTAIEFYLDVLEIAPDEVDARTNIETAQLLIKDLLDKLKQQQQQQDPTSQPSECEQQEEQGDEQQEEQGDEQQAGNEQQKQEQGEEGEQQTGEEQEQRQLTEEEARRLLQGVRDKEQQRREERALRSRAGRTRVAKDW